MMRVPCVGRALIAALVATVCFGACRGNRTASPTDAVVRFYTMREALAISGAPTESELAALRPFIADTLAHMLTAADARRTADRQRAPLEKPSFADGDIFSSLFEGPTAFKVLPAVGEGTTVRVPVEFTNDGTPPPVKWTDTVVVVQERGHWVVQDLRYGGTWGFGASGSLLMQLKPQ